MNPEQIQDYISQMLEGNRRAIARLITIIENGGTEVSKQIIRTIYPHTGNAYIIGVTGAPGSGKSTLVNQLATQYLKQDLKVAVLAIDPSSPFSGGALLGDRIRMKDNFRNKKLFIRSMANRGQLGGLAHMSKDVIQVLDAAGYDIILLETVGVGQSEIDVFKAANTTLVVVVPGMGDDIQALKAGIMEITDIFVVNKCDRPLADKRVNEIEATLDLGESLEISDNNHNVRVIRSTNWRPPVVKTNALLGEHIDTLVEQIAKHRKLLNSSDVLDKRLHYRNKHYVLEILKCYSSRNIEDLIFTHGDIDLYIKKMLTHNKGMDPYTLSEEIMSKFIIRYLESPGK